VRLLLNGGSAGVGEGETAGVAPGEGVGLAVGDSAYTVKLEIRAIKRIAMPTMSSGLLKRNLTNRINNLLVNIDSARRYFGQSPQLKS
jgi:hypothetical protein